VTKDADHFGMQTGSLVRVEAIITSLVFDHALRIRLKAETPDTKPLPGVEAAPDATTAAVAAQPEELEVVQAAEGETSSEGSTTTEHSRNTTAASASSAASTTASTVVGSTAASSKDAKKDKDTKKDKEKDDKKDDKKSSNLIGRINNLVTSDLKSITNGRDFLLVGLNAPINIALGMWFLYWILGWSSFVGLAVMIALMPAPAFFANQMSGVQKKKMTAVR
jgi:cobalamin biosynthesis Mg chelatase CobN